ncbi:MAG: hypothetical protein IPG26_00010 [Coprothermobacter sp.]|nr:hypothetical protein [Coprothermobacter sp.]
MFDDIFQQFFGNEFSDLFPEFFERRKRDITDYLSSSSLSILQNAANLAGAAGYDELTPEHLAYALLRAFGKLAMDLSNTALMWKR